MVRVMTIGYGPLPGLGLDYIAGSALRTRHLLKPILDAGHTVNLFTLPLPGTEQEAGEVPAMVPANDEGFAFQTFTSHRGEFIIHALNEQVDQLQPDAILGIGAYPSYIAAMMSTAIPLWADLDSYWLSDVQARCWARGADRSLSGGWRIELAILRRLDKFSAVSRSHLHAILGELAMTGRLNHATYQYPFGHHLPNAAYRWPEPEAAEAEEGEPGDGGEAILRGPVTPPDAFIILWSGSFKPWADIEALVDAMGRLMEHHPTVHFVSTGGRAPTDDLEIYRKFQDLVEQSPYKSRFHLLGWVRSDRLPRIYREADLGILLDGRNYQTMFGGRQRINTMVAHDLPVATTLGSEISEWLTDGQAIIELPLSDPQGVADAIVPYVDRLQPLGIHAVRARKIMNEDFSERRTTQPLIHWLDDPQLAPDNRIKLDRTEGALTDLNTEPINDVDEIALLVQRHPLDELRRLAEEPKADDNANKPRGLRGLLFGRK